MVASFATIAPATTEKSFSFYVSVPSPRRIRQVAQLADAVVVRGAGGPQAVAHMRAAGWRGTTLFDYAGYESKSRAIDPPDWMERQARAGADRLLTPGRWVRWDPKGDALTTAIEAESNARADLDESTVVLAVDSRWLTRGLEKLVDSLSDYANPVALVLGHRSDPLAPQGAVNGLLAVARAVPQLDIFRSDHGAIGAVAFGAAHGSVGLSTTYRHFVPPTVRAGGRPNDRSARVFVRDLMDWFSASNIAGWSTTRVTFSCSLSCCNGKTIDRFLDSRLRAEADAHNMEVLADVARYVLEAPAPDRRREFAKMCDNAAKHYGYMGKLSMHIAPKSQLLQWAQFA